jgi:DNA-binding NarL/FixJ family response regulator
MREGIEAVIGHESDMVLAGEACDGQEAIRRFREIQPDITLMDMRLPDMNGIDAMITIRTEAPAARIIMLTTFEGDAEIQRALEAGAQGYMLKSMPRKQLVEMIRRVHAGKKLIPPQVAAHVAEHLGEEPLSKREIEVLEKVAGGNRNIDIAVRLFISEETVKGHLKHIMEKLGARDRTEAVAIAVRRGIIHL